MIGKADAKQTLGEFQNNTCNKIDKAVEALKEEVQECVLEALSEIEVCVSFYGKRGDSSTRGLAIGVCNSDCEDIAEPKTLIELLTDHCEIGWEEESMVAVIADVRAALDYLEKEYKEYVK